MPQLPAIFPFYFMPKINFHWLSYYTGCILGGIILGFIVAKALEVPVGADYHPPIYSSESLHPSPLSSPTPDKLVTLLFTGDVMLGRSVNKNIQQSHDPHWPFIYVRDLLRSADITYINLENPLITNCPVTDTGMKFCGDIGSVVGLTYAGIDVASLANNHASNFGPAGLEETIRTLESNNIRAIGGDRFTTISIEDHKYTFYSFNDIGEDAMQTMSKFPKQDNELIIVTFHWGSEYQSKPSNRQITLAHLAIDNGADLVVGAHPHWVQTSEVYKGKPIYYSLGNFIFDQEWSLATKKGLVIRLTYRGLELVKSEELPVFIQNYGQPRLH